MKTLRQENKLQVGDKIKSFEVKHIVREVETLYRTNGSKIKCLAYFALIESENGQQRVIRADKRNLNDCEKYHSTFKDNAQFSEWAMFTNKF